LDKVEEEDKWGTELGSEHHRRFVGIHTWAERAFPPVVGRAETHHS
jgi:hypothetical protein